MPKLHRAKIFSFAWLGFDRCGRQEGFRFSNYWIHGRMSKSRTTLKNSRRLLTRWNHTRPDTLPLSTLAMHGKRLKLSNSIERVAKVVVNLVNQTGILKQYLVTQQNLPPIGIRNCASHFTSTNHRRRLKLWIIF